MKFNKTLEKWNKEMPGVTSMASETPIIHRLPTGIFYLDLFTNGGIPYGKITEFYGCKSSGKSTTALRVVGEYLRRNPEMLAIWFDFEQSFDRNWAKNFIDENDFNRLPVPVPTYGELGVNMIGEAADCDDIGLIVIDSIAELIPLKDITEGSENKHMGLLASLVTNLLSKLMPAIGNARRLTGRELTVLIINQIRANMSQYGSDVNKPGGYRLGLLASLDIRFYTEQYTKSGEIPFKSKHIFKIEKNKAGGSPKRQGDFTVYIEEVNGYKRGEIEDETELVISWAKRMEIIYRDGGWCSPHFKGVKLLKPNKSGDGTDLVTLYKKDRMALDELKEIVIQEFIKQPIRKEVKEDE